MIATIAATLTHAARRGMKRPSPVRRNLTKEEIVAIIKKATGHESEIVAIDVTQMIESNKKKSGGFWRSLWRFAKNLFGAIWTVASIVTIGAAAISICHSAAGVVKIMLGRFPRIGTVPDGSHINGRLAGEST